MTRRQRRHRPATALCLAVWAAALGPRAAGADEASGPLGADRLAGDAIEYRTLARLRLGDAVLEMPALVAMRAEAATAFALDRYGTTLPAGAALGPLARLGLRFDGSWALPVPIVAEVEADLVTGAVDLRAPDGPGGPVGSDSMPNAQGLAPEMRKAYVRASFGPTARELHLGAGFMTSHWGMGLVANDGAHGWEPGTARFTDPRGGDRVLRAFAGTGPHGDARLGATVAADWVVGDDVLLAGDQAMQMVGALVLGQGNLRRPSAGLYAVGRWQKAPSGRDLFVVVTDLTARSEIPLGDPARPLRLVLEAEAAHVWGTTTLGPTADHPQHQVWQFGAAARATLRARSVGGVLDVLYASGDRNFDDGMQNAFRPDPNFEVGMLLYRYVVAGQTAQGRVTAADPALVGQPAPDLNRLPTRGSATNTIAVFPRAFWRPVDGLEIYGGALFAFAATDNADPFNTRIAGGVPRNALDGATGRYLGTELDVGVRWRALIHGTEVQAGLEGGWFSPGAALQDAQGNAMAPIFGGRLMLQYRL